MGLTKIDNMYIRGYIILECQ